MELKAPGAVRRRAMAFNTPTCPPDFAFTPDGMMYMAIASPATSWSAPRTPATNRASPAVKTMGRRSRKRSPQAGTSGIFKLGHDNRSGSRLNPRVSSSRTRRSAGRLRKATFQAGATRVANVSQGATTGADTAHHERPGFEQRSSSGTRRAASGMTSIPDKSRTGRDS